MGVSPEIELPRATAGDLGYLVELAADPAVEPFLAPGSGGEDRLRALLEEWSSGIDPGGLFLIRRAHGELLGGLAIHVFSRHSGICELSRLMVSPAARGAGVGSEAVRLACRRAFGAGFHRIQAETYGDNLAAQRLFERVGFRREGLRRRAYWRRERWLDGVLYGLLAEELDDPGDGRGSRVDPAATG